MIEKHGSMLIGVMPGEDDEQPFTYSIGNMFTYHQPDIIAFGLPNDIAAHFLNEITDRLTNGEIKVNEEITDMTEGAYGMYLFPVERENAIEYMVQADYWYEQSGIDNWEVLEVIFQDKKYRYPWDKGYNIGADEIILSDMGGRK